MRQVPAALLLLAPLTLAAAGADAPGKADPTATKLLAEARAARALWGGFPGFTAAIEINHDGKRVQGHVDVDAKGHVRLKVPGGEAQTWAKQQLASLVGHRLDSGGDRQTPCAFVGNNTEHPLGRAVRVLGDEMHSSFRIRDRQILEVNRHMSDSRFTITVLENRVTPEKKFLPASFVVNTWDVHGGRLRSSEAHHTTWVRVGHFDLPQTLTVVTALPGSPASGTAATGTAPAANGGGSLQARSLKLSGHHLLP
jgi:hypothetical protein